MARDAVAFIGALGFSKVDLLLFSLGGFVAQVIAQQQPGLVRKIILAATGPAGGMRCRRGEKSIRSKHPSLAGTLL
jgi:pimeloyl-ACP methyl ester carboxylesterase